MIVPPLATTSAVASTGSALKAAFTTVPGSIVRVAGGKTTTLPAIETFPVQVRSVVTSVTCALISNPKKIEIESINFFIFLKFIKFFFY